MKQETPATMESNASTCRRSSAPVARARVSRTKDSPRVDSLNGASLSPVSMVNNRSTIRRSIFPNKPKEKGTEEPKIVDQPTSRTVEHYVQVRRQGSEYQNDLERRLGVSRRTVKELKSEVLALEVQLEKLKSQNVLLESQNKQLERSLSSAEAKIKALERQDQVEPTIEEIKPSEFKDARELIANKLGVLPVKRDVFKRDGASKLQSLDIRRKVQLTVPPSPFRAPPVTGPPPPPPPPPPPSRSVASRANTMQKATSLVEFYHSITKRNEKKGKFGSENCACPVASKVHNSIVDELQNRSAHLLAIKADVETKGDFINYLIQKIQSTAFTDIEEVLTFVDWLDGQLSTLADERAVLKHFDWPERKADAWREAAFEYRDLKRLLAEVSSFEDDVSLPCEATLRKITNLLDKSERSVQRLIRLRDTNMLSYKDSKIPIDWMFDSGMVSKIKQTAAKLAKVFINRVSTELELARHADRESTHEALLLRGVRFAYRAYQFGGGLGSETMRAFEEFRERVQLHGRGSRDLVSLA